MIVVEKCIDKRFLPISIKVSLLKISPELTSFDFRFSKFTNHISFVVCALHFIHALYRLYYRYSFSLRLNASLV